MRSPTKNILSLTLVSAIIAVLLAITNLITAPIIAKQERAAVEAALSEVMPDAGGFTQVDIMGLSLDESVTEVYAAADGGYVIRLNVTGYQPNMVILCGVSAEGEVTGAVCISSGETLGREKTYGGKFVGLDADGVGKVDTIASATKTTSAYKSAVMTAIETAKTLSETTGGTN